MQRCRSLHFHAKTLEMPNTDALQYMMYKGMRGALADLTASLDETLEREFNRISDKGLYLLPLIKITVMLLEMIYSE